MHRGLVRLTLIEWAGQSILYCSGARAYYDQQKEKGQTPLGHRPALAFKWIRILWKCWSTRTPYDEKHYFKALAKRQSPLLAAIATTKT